MWVERGDPPYNLWSSKALLTHRSPSTQWCFGTFLDVLDISSSLGQGRGPHSLLSPGSAWQAHWLHLPPPAPPNSHLEPEKPTGPVSLGGHPHLSWSRNRDGQGPSGHLPISKEWVGPRAEVWVSSICPELDLGHLGPVGERDREASPNRPSRWRFLRETPE